MEIPNTVLRVVMDERSNAIKTEVIRQETIIVWVAIGVHTCLQRRDNVGIFLWGNRVKEDVSAIAREEEHILFGLEVEI